VPAEAAEVVRAAGAVLWRPGSEGIEVCAVHRPAYDDWSLPKGKLAPDEDALVAAVREVLEETGFPAVPQMRLPGAAYDLPDGRAKTVDFWLMRAGEAPAADIMDPAEVDRIEWLDPATAATRLSYPHDRDLVRLVAELPPVTAVTALVRHGHAGERKAWAGNDALRPIDPAGQVEADRLGVLLTPLQPRHLYAATPLRCKQTLEPLAEATGLPIVTDSAFAEPADPDDAPAKAKVAAVRLAELRADGVAVICSQGKVIPPLLALLHGAEDPEAYKTPKGGAWLLTWSDDRLIGLTRL
jgi:8-oxo-dGTP pyrophosphatase MutT (NUDIX family)/phosphohistidine phosphatase SixA